MTEMATLWGRQSGTVTKVARYNWKVQDRPGHQTVLSKRALKVHTAYQRHVVAEKVKRMAGNWSWLGCGAIIIGERGGEYWVIDGQNRVMAAMLRADIDLLPCIVFQTESLAQDAAGFLVANTERKPVGSHDKFRAAIVAEDEVACHISDLLAQYNIVVDQNAERPLHIKSVALLLRRAKEDEAMFGIVMRLVAELCRDCSIKEMLVEGLFYIHQHHDGGVDDRRLRARILAVGAERLMMGAKRASAYYTRGGYKVWGNGMLDELNKGLVKKFALT